MRRKGKERFFQLNHTNQWLPPTQQAHVKAILAAQLTVQAKGAVWEEVVSLHVISDPAALCSKAQCTVWSRGMVTPVQKWCHFMWFLSLQHCAVRQSAHPGAEEWWAQHTPGCARWSPSQPALPGAAGSAWRRPGPGSWHWPAHWSGTAHSRCLSSEQPHGGNSDLYYQPVAERAHEINLLFLQNRCFM